MVKALLIFFLLAALGLAAIAVYTTVRDVETDEDDPAAKRRSFKHRKKQK